MTVDLNAGTATLLPARGARLRPSDVAEAVRGAGFRPGEITIEATGTGAGSGGRWEFTLDGDTQAYLDVPSSGQPDGPVRVRATIASDGRARLSSVTPGG